MNIIHFNTPPSSGSAVTVGSFDGIHLGHKKIFSLLKKISLQYNIPGIIITFRQHPRLIVQPSYNLKLLTLIDEKIELLQKLDIDFVQFLDFNKQMADLSAEEFIKKYLIDKLNLKHLIVGFNHRLGKNRQAGYEELKAIGQKLGFQVHLVSPLIYKNNYISSSRIRKALTNCDLENANNMLGYNYFCYARVVKGNNIGSKLGFPTANLLINKQKLLPCPGVYAVKVKINNNTYNGILNYGKRPTIDSSPNLIPEVHIFDFSENIYNKTIKITFIKRIRDEQKFNSLQELKNQIQIDIKTAKLILS